LETFFFIFGILSGAANFLSISGRKDFNLIIRKIVYDTWQLLKMLEHLVTYYINKEQNMISWFITSRAPRHLHVIHTRQLVFGINPRMLYFIPWYKNLFPPTIPDPDPKGRNWCYCSTAYWSQSTEFFLFGALLNT
jgi:hypothetical protein